MLLSEWILGTNQILNNASQHLPPAYVEILRQQQMFWMAKGLETGHITIGAGDNQDFGWKDGTFQIPHVPYKEQQPPTLEEWEQITAPDWEKSIITDRPQPQFKKQEPFEFKR